MTEEIARIGIPQMTEDIKRELKPFTVEDRYSIISTSADIAFAFSKDRVPEGMNHVFGEDINLSLGVDLQFDVVDEKEYEIGGKEYEKRKKSFEKRK